MLISIYLFVILKLKIKELIMNLITAKIILEVFFQWEFKFERT